VEVLEEFLDTLGFEIGEAGAADAIIVALAPTSVEDLDDIADFLADFLDKGEEFIKAALGEAEGQALIDAVQEIIDAVFEEIQELIEVEDIFLWVPTASEDALGVVPQDVQQPYSGGTHIYYVAGEFNGAIPTVNAFLGLNTNPNWFAYNAAGDTLLPGATTLSATNETLITLRYRIGTGVNAQLSVPHPLLLVPVAEIIVDWGDDFDGAKIEVAFVNPFDGSTDRRLFEFDITDPIEFRARDVASNTSRGIIMISSNIDGGLVATGMAIGSSGETVAINLINAGDGSGESIDIATIQVHQGATEIFNNDPDDDVGTFGSLAATAFIEITSAVYTITFEKQ
jgi:hypothetical protein